MWVPLAIAGIRSIDEVTAPVKLVGSYLAHPDEENRLGPLHGLSQRSSHSLRRETAVQLYSRLCLRRLRVA
jgi:hypothetical protein